MYSSNWSEIFLAFSEQSRSIFSKAFVFLSVMPTKLVLYFNLKSEILS